MQYVSVRSVASRLKSLFKIDMDIFDVVQGCADALKLLKMIALERSIYQCKIDNFCVNLPGTVWKVRGVVRLDQVDQPPVTIDVQDIFFPPQIIFTQTETDLTKEGPILFKANYVPQFKGPYIDFVWDCPLLKFNETDVEIAVEVTGLKVDEEKFPMIPEESFYACLYYCLYVFYQPLFLLKQIDLQTMQQVEAWKDAKFRQAHASNMIEGLNTNERDHLFNIMTSMDRKAFNYPV